MANERARIRGVGAHAATAREGPAGIWIELTSKCPLRCIFCSRENLRGEGEHMDFALFERLLDSLHAPEIIRLNYAGESANYPALIEAITKAKQVTGAHTEMVTSLVSMPLETVGRLPSSGIDRISISLHTLDRNKFPVLYGGGSLDGFERRLHVLLAAACAEPRAPIIDYAVVGMQTNAGELATLVAFAAASGAPAVSVHPVIRRIGVPPLFHLESDASGILTAEFRSELEASVEIARAATPGIHVSVARPPDPAATGDCFTCEQNPFETTHILANGDVVACEVLDRIPLGTVREQDFRRIWNGSAYREFRSRYLRNQVPECRACIFRAPVAKIGPVRPTWGWHTRDEAGALWSRASCSFECEGGTQNSLTLTGLLPPGPESNTIEFLRDGVPVAVVCNDGEEPAHFRVVLPLNESAATNQFVAHVGQVFSPWRKGLSGDARVLGFALFTAEFGTFARSGPEPQPATDRRRLSLSAKQTATEILLSTLDRLAFPMNSRSAFPSSLPDDSLAILIPERGNPATLDACLQALAGALSSIAVPVEVTVVINGSNLAEYTDLRKAHPHFRFRSVMQPLGFTNAIRTGLRQITAGWTYLLNSDVLLDERAISALLPHRAPGIFSLASRIITSGLGAGRETNRTAIEFIDGLANLVELDPNAKGPVEHIYSGGGASLFQTEWLRVLSAYTLCYDPFYWEDAEWGVCARALGLRNLFVPESLATHEGRATIRRFYAPAEVSRIFERNRIQFQLRCIPDKPTPAVRERLLHAPWRTVYELSQPARVGSMLRARARLCEWKSDPRPCSEPPISTGSGALIPGRPEQLSHHAR